MYAFLKKFLFVLEPEIAHSLVKKSGPLIPKKLLTQVTKFNHKTLKTTLGQQPLDNPIGLAAGFDKNGEVIDLMGALGFGFIELGSVTAFPCEGNPKPRVFRLPKDQSLINRLGLPNWGAERIATHLNEKHIQYPYGVNIAKTPSDHLKRKISGIDDFLMSLRLMDPFGCYTVLNLSCPNTKDGQPFEAPSLFEDLAKEVCAERKELKSRKPYLVKLSPQIKKEDLHKIVDVANKYSFDGFVVSNTTTNRDDLRTDTSLIKKIGRGGLSGAALTTMANEQLQRVGQIIEKKQILMGVGGIMSFEDLLTKLAYGAQYFQLYTGLVYQGPFLIRQLNRQLARLCQKVGVSHYQELIGQKELLPMVQ